MGVAIPQVITEDKADSAQIIDGSLRFDSSKTQILSRTFSTTGTNNKIQTLSVWVKFNSFTNNLICSGYDGVGAYGHYLNLDANGALAFYLGGDAGFLITTQLFRDPSAWYHIVATADTTQGSASDYLKLYINGVRVTAFSSTSNPSLNQTSHFALNNSNNRIGTSWGSSAYGYANNSMSNFYFIDGQALTPSSFGYTDPLTNTWRPKRYTGTYGTNGFYLPMDGNTPIGQDRSGNSNDWTPVNFGGSNTIEKATGALPILNTDGGGKVARVGVRTDSNASSLVLALPLVGIKSDFSNAVNSGTSNKAITVVGGATASSTQSNFYGGSFSFDGSGDALTITNSDMSMGTSNFTCEGWFYYNSLPSSSAYRLLGTVNTFGNSTEWGLIHQTAGTLTLWNGSSYVSTGTAPISTGRWTHLAVIRASNVQTLYVNGIAQSTTVTHTGNLTHNIFDIGGRNDGAESFNGYIQDVRIYKGLAKYTQNFIPASTDPDILPDTPSGVAYSSNVALVPSTDGAVAFDGSGDYLELAYSSDYDFTGQFTLEGFVYPNISTGDHSVFGNFTTNATGYWGLAFDYSTYGTFTVFYYQGNTSISNTGYVPIPRAWNHYAVTRDASNVIRVFLNGQLLPTTATYSGTLGVTSQNSFIGWRAGLNPLNGFISNVHWVKGTCLYTSNFTPPTAPISSVANTKLLCCKSNSSATAFDVSPGTITANGNAAASNFNPFTVNINTQRGKQSGYCTLNPLQSSGTLSNGNLSFSSAGANWYASVSNIFRNTGKWYCEYFITSAAGPVGSIHIGIVPIGYAFAAGAYIGNTSTSYAYRGDGTKYVNALNSSYGASFTTGDLIGVAFDADSGSLTCYKNGVSQGVLSTGISGDYAMAVSCNGTNGVNSVDANFGQKPFKFPPPAGFQPLTLANTPRPTIVRPDQYVGVTTYSGLGNSGMKVSGYNFKPDLIWIKARNQTYNNILYDSVRGTGQNTAIFSDDTAVEGSYSQYVNLSSFDSDGFTVGSTGANNNAMSSSSANFVAWAWKAGGNSNTFNIDDVGYATASAAGLTAGTITPTGASVNTKSGFSIITYTGTNADATISHGLGKIPQFIIAKSRNSSSWNWIVYHQALGVSDYLALESTQGSDTRFANIWGSGHTTSVFGVKTGYSNNPNGVNMVAYCWAEIPGFSKFGSYTGNGSADGSVVITGFRPRYLLIKDITSGGLGQDWVIIDSLRDNYNVIQSKLYANLSSQEAVNTNNAIDFLSNGFKMRSSNSATNASGDTYIYAAFAEAPTFNLYGAQANAR